MARLSIVAPTPAIAQKVEEWHATTQPTAPPIVVPVATKGLDLPAWLARFWPTLKTVTMARYIQALDANGFDPVEPASAIQPWAHMAARGYLELEWAANKGTTGNAPRPLKGSFRTPFGPLDQYSALVVQARGSGDPNAQAAVMAYVCYYHPADALAVYAVMGKADWHVRLAGMV